MANTASATSEWLNPPYRPDIIEQLISGVDRYNPSNGSILEEYLLQQLQRQQYDCLANLAILKLYQFNPDLLNPHVVVNVLLKALTSLNTADFSLCLSLLGERHMALNAIPSLEPVISLLSELSSNLAGCRFPAFWDALNKASKKAEEDGPDGELGLLNDYLATSVGFEDGIREVVAKSVRAAFRCIGVDRLQRYLDLDGSDFNAFLAEKEWTLDGNVVRIPPNADNDIKATVVRENIQMSQLTKCLAQSQAA